MKNVLLSAIAAITMTACDNEAQYNPQLPAITQVGANMFGCKIDGIIIIPQDAKIQGNPGGGLVKGLELSILTDAKCIKAVDAQYNRGGVLIKIPNAIVEAGEYKIEPIGGGFAESWPNFLYMQVTKNGQFYGSMENTGKINFIRKDGIWAGTFYCKLKNRDNPNDIIEVTEGRFDIKVN